MHQSVQTSSPPPRSPLTPDIFGHMWGLAILNDKLVKKTNVMPNLLLFSFCNVYFIITELINALNCCN